MVWTCAASPRISAISCSEAPHLATSSCRPAPLSSQGRRPLRWTPVGEATQMRAETKLRCASTGENTAQWRVKLIESDDELLRFLQLVLQGYFESSFGGMFQGDHSDHVKNFMRQKLASEMEILKKKYESNGDKSPENTCLIAVGEGTGHVVGGCEICMCERMSGIVPACVPAAEKDAFAVENLIVEPELRRQGIGTMLMDTLLEQMVQWSGSGIYVQVEAQNEEALAFYAKRQFQILKSIDNMDPRVNIGRVLLLKLDLLA